jgi:hypothetical protein
VVALIAVGVVVLVVKARKDRANAD